jgi:hypothetical protein
MQAGIECLVSWAPRTEGPFVVGPTQGVTMSLTGPLFLDGLVALTVAAFIGLVVRDLVDA